MPGRGTANPELVWKTATGPHWLEQRDCGENQWDQLKIQLERSERASNARRPFGMSCSVKTLQFINVGFRWVSLGVMAPKRKGSVGNKGSTAPGILSAAESSRLPSLEAAPAGWETGGPPRQHGVCPAEEVVPKEGIILPGLQTRSRNISWEHTVGWELLSLLTYHSSTLSLPLLSNPSVGSMHIGFERLW